MKKFLMSAIVFALCSIGAANAQLEKGSVLVGGSIGDIRFGLGSGSYFSLNLTPRVGYFVQNNLAFGAKVNDKGNDTVNIVREHLSEGLKEEFVVEPNKKEDKKIQPKVQESKQQPTEEVEHLPSLDELENEINGKVK